MKVTNLLPPIYFLIFFLLQALTNQSQGFLIPQWLSDCLKLTKNKYSAVVTPPPKKENTIPVPVNTAAVQFKNFEEKELTTVQGLDTTKTAVATNSAPLDWKNIETSLLNLAGTLVVVPVTPTAVQFKNIGEKEPATVQGLATPKTAAATNSAPREGRPSFPSLQSFPQPPINSKPANNFAPDTSNVFKTEVQPKVYFNVTNSEERRWSNHVNNILSQGVAKFAINMDRAIDATRLVTSSIFDRENVVFSPLNLAGTLAVVLLGSGDRTFDEIARILGFDVGIDISAHSEVVHQMFGVLLDSIQTSGKSSEISSAGSVFVQRGYSIRKEFATIAQNVYKNDIIDVDFLQRPDLAYHIINNWVNEKTQGKISSILPENPSPDTKVILASALYFSGEWNQHFSQGATNREPFYLASGRIINVDMMSNIGEFPFYEDKQLGVKILGLPYKNSDSATTGNSLKFKTMMYVLLPTAMDSNALHDLESRITPEVINSLISKMITEPCEITFPRMKLSSTLSLNRALESLGLTSLFTPGAANLGLLSTGLNNNYPLPSQSTSDSSIFSRINSEDDTNSTIQAPSPAVSSTGEDLSGKKNHIRYTDSQGGYDVQQWSSEAYLEKIDGGIRKRQVKNNRPIDPGFLEFVKAKGFRSYGLDDIRNSANFVNPGLYASDVLHKVEMDITETGTVAASTSGVLLRKSRGQRFLNGNRPFLFFIRHEPSSLILFWGTVNKPSPYYD